MRPLPPPMRFPSYQPDQHHNECWLGKFHSERFPNPSTMPSGAEGVMA